MARKHLVSFVSSFMLQATSYASDGAPLAFDGDVRFATGLDDRPLPQPQSTFKLGHPQQSLARHMDAIPAGSPVHLPTLDQNPTHSTATALEPASHQRLTEGPRQTTGRELRRSAIPNPAPTANDAKPGPVLESLAKKSHARRQPNGHIPRPRNAFILFRCDFVAQKKIPASVEPDHRNISRIVGRIWKAMSDEDRRPWIEEAKRERENHKKLYPQYRYSPSSTTTAAAASPLKEKRTHYQKIRESMGVLPAWEVTPHTGSTAQSSQSQPTQELQLPEMTQAEMPPREGPVLSDVPWRIPAALECGDSATSHTMSRELSFTQSVNWETLSQSQDWSVASNTEGQYCPAQGLTSTPSPSQEVVPFDILATSSHFDSPDPSPVQMTQILPPFMFVAGHHATTNPEFPTFRYSSPTVGDVSAPALPFADSSASLDDPALRYQSHPHDFEMNPENFFEGPAWITDQIDDIIRNIESGSSLDYASQQ